MENNLLDNRLYICPRPKVDIRRINELVSASICCIEKNIEIKQEWFDEIYDILSRYKEF